VGWGGVGGDVRGPGHGTHISCWIQNTTQHLPDSTHPGSFLLHHRARAAHKHVTLLLLLYTHGLQQGDWCVVTKSQG
jgi:hypothetical protein